MDDRRALTQQFSDRLVRLLRQAGHSSRSASSGVKVKLLAENAGCSFEMARRYTTGDALPDVQTVNSISTWLNVDPGWLLYGTAKERDTKKYSPIVLSKSDMKLLIERIAPIYCALQPTDEILTNQLHDFFCEVISDYATLQAPDEMKLKILETSIASALRFFPYSDKNLPKSLLVTNGAVHDIT